MYCPKCGQENPDGSSYCGNCGADLGSSGVSPSGSETKKSKDNTILGILALIFSFVFFPAGVILGTIAFTTGQGEEKQLGKIALVIDVVMAGVAILTVLIVGIVAVSLNWAAIRQFLESIQSGAHSSHSAIAGCLPWGF